MQYSAEVVLHGKIAQPYFVRIVLSFRVYHFGSQWSSFGHENPPSGIMENDIGMAKDSTDEETSDNNKQYALFCNIEL